MSALPPIPPDIAKIAAPILFGTVWNWTLFGVLVVQIYVYSYNFPEDRKLIKLLVYSVFFLETLQTALSGADLYYWFASGFGNMNHLSRPYASSFDVPIIGAVVSVAVQYFLAYRIWVLSNKKTWWLCLAICICSTIDGVAALTGGIYAHVLNKFAGTRALNALAETWLIGNTVSDILITSAMLYLCLRRRGNGQLTDHALSRIVRLTVETNAVTTADGITSVIMLFAFPDRNWFACPTAFIGKLYSNTLLVSLNNRISIRDGSFTRLGKGVNTSQSTSTSAPNSGVPPGIVHLDLEMSPRSFEGKT